MSYLAPGGEGGFSAGELELLCRLLDVPVPKSGPATTALAGALRDQLAAIDAIERLPLDELEPALGFDPRWQDSND